jgi:predicted methyltransferase
MVTPRWHGAARRILVYHAPTRHHGGYTMFMSRTALATAGLLALLASSNQVSFAADVPAAIGAAVADAGRPEADRVRDENRKPGEVVAFAGIKAGDKVADLLPGGGYFTRIFSKTVGAQGKVYAIVSSAILEKRPTVADGVKAIAADANYGGNVVVHPQALESLSAPEPLDVVWTSLNYHDLKNAMFGPADTVAMNKAILKALKPGGTYIIIDHVAEAGSGTRDTETLHRIDPAVVKSEVVSAGFTFEGESNLLKHPDDNHTFRVVEGSIRGKTDQFIYKFRKPK